MAGTDCSIIGRRSSKRQTHIPVERVAKAAKQWGKNEDIAVVTARRAGSIFAGERFTLVSDGVVEAANAGELLGFERTREISVRDAANIAGPAKAWGQNDDIAVVTVRRAAVAA